MHVSLIRTYRPGNNSHWVKDLKIQDQKNLSSYYFKMKKVPLGQKRVKLSNHHTEIDGYGKKIQSLWYHKTSKHL